MAQIRHYKCNCGYELNVWNGPNYLGTKWYRVLRCKICGEYQVVCEGWKPGQELCDVSEYTCESCGYKSKIEEIFDEQMEKGLICQVCGKKMWMAETIMVD